MLYKIMSILYIFFFFFMNIAYKIDIYHMLPKYLKKQNFLTNY